MSHLSPGHKEIAKKVYEATRAVIAGERWIAVRPHYVANCAELFIDEEREFWDLILASLDEIRAAIPHQCYAGHHPPEKAGEQEIKGLDLWPFRWDSKIWSAKLLSEDPELLWDRLMYLKFVLKKDTQPNTSKYGHVDIHKNR